jgi:predicted nucleic acid-binding protein
LTVVLDANVAVALATDDPRASVVQRQIQHWDEIGEELHAPSLFSYEALNALARKVAANQLTPRDAALAWEQITVLQITLHDLVDGSAVLAIAKTLQRETAYDAAYIALAQELSAELWTLDGPLARNAAGVDLPVRLIELT